MKIAILAVFFAVVFMTVGLTTVTAQSALPCSQRPTATLKINDEVAYDCQVHVGEAQRQDYSVYLVTYVAVSSIIVDGQEHYVGSQTSAIPVQVPLPYQQDYHVQIKGNAPYKGSTNEPDTRIQSPDKVVGFSMEYRPLLASPQRPNIPLIEPQSFVVVSARYAAAQTACHALQVHLPSYSVANYGIAAKAYQEGISALSQGEVDHANYVCSQAMNGGGGPNPETGISPWYILLALVGGLLVGGIGGIVMGRRR